MAGNPEVRPQNSRSGAPSPAHLLRWFLPLILLLMLAGRWAVLLAEQTLDGSTILIFILLDLLILALVGWTCLRVIHPPGRAANRDQAAALAGDHAPETRQAGEEQSGTIADAASDWESQRGPDRSDPGRRASIRDMIDHKRTLEKVEHSRRLLQAIYDNVPVMMCVLDQNLAVLYANRAMAEYAGRSPFELKSNPPGGVLSCINVLDDPRGCGSGRKCESCALRLALADTFRTGRSHRGIEHQAILGVSGNHKEVALLGSTALIPLGDGTGLLLCLADVTERKRAEDDLTQALQRLGAHMDNSPLAVVEFDPGFRVIRWSQGAERLFGWAAAEIVGRPIGQVRWVFEDDRESVHQVRSDLLSGRQPRIVTVNRNYRKDGAIIHCEWHNSAIHDARGRLTSVLSLVLDVTERKHSEEELVRHRDHLEELVNDRTRELEESRTKLQRAERLASIGTLAAGIAHEINNPLGVILLSTDRAMSALDRPAALRELLRQQKQEVQRCARIVRGVLDFARERSTEKWSLDFNEFVRRGLDFTQEFARRHEVTVEARLAERLNSVLGNSTEMEQVVVNLVFNAVQACAPGGQVLVRTYAVDGCVRLAVRDNGCGMTPGQMEHIFDPFFTTRLKDGGTGLGLSTVHGIVSSHGGSIDIVSEPGRGAEFTVELPCVAQTEAAHGQDTGS